MLIGAKLVPSSHFTRVRVYHLLYFKTTHMCLSYMLYFKNYTYVPIIYVTTQTTTTREIVVGAFAMGQGVQKSKATSNQPRILRPCPTEIISHVKDGWQHFCSVKQGDSHLYI